LLDKPERFLPHVVGTWLLSLRDFLADSEFTLEIVNTYMTAFSWTTYWQGFTRGSTDAANVSKSNASQTSVLLTESDQTPEFRKKHLQSLQRAQFSGHVKVFQDHARGQYGDASSKIHTRFSVQSATANIGLMDQIRRVRNCFQHLTQAHLLSRRTNRLGATSATTGTGAAVPPITQSLLSLSHHSKQIPATTNPRDTRHRGRADSSNRQYHLPLSRPS
jgi:hypothetical protein